MDTYPFISNNITKISLLYIEAKIEKVKTPIKRRAFVEIGNFGAMPGANNSDE